MKFTFMKYFVRKLFLPLAVTALACLFGAALLYRTFDLPGFRARLFLEDQSPTVVQKIRSLSRLETVSFTEQKMLEGRKEWQRVPQWLAGDKLLFMAHGEVVAGVDLSRFGPEHLRWNGEEVKVRLPRPEVFHVRLDNRASKVHHRSTGWLNKSDAQLESKVRQKADEALLAGALQEGILDHARRNAEHEIGNLLKGFGAKNVTFM